MIQITTSTVNNLNKSNRLNSTFYQELIILKTNKDPLTNHLSLFISELYLFCKQEPKNHLISSPDWLLQNR